MELATIFLIWLAITIIDNLATRKKRRLPPQNDSSDLDYFPKFPSNPTSPEEDISCVIGEPKIVEIRPNSKPPARIKPKVSVQEVREETTELDLNLTPSNVMNAFVLSEILGKPKALRR